MRASGFAAALILIVVSSAHAQFPDGHGKITQPFAAKLLPTLHEIGELKAQNAYTPAILADIATLDKLTKNSDEGALLAFMKDELARYI